MRETRELKMISLPDAYDEVRGVVYDIVKFLDESNNEYWYISKSCTANGGFVARSNLLTWAWVHNIDDKVTITAEFKNGKIYRPTIK